MSKAKTVETVSTEPNARLSFLNYGNDAAAKMKSNTGTWDWLDPLPTNQKTQLTMVANFDSNYVISFLQHFIQGKDKKVGFTCIGATNGCLGCLLGDEPKQRVILPVMTQDGKTRIWGVSPTVARQLKAEELLSDGGIGGNIFNIVKTGEKMETKYSFKNTNRVDERLQADDFEMPDMLKFLYGLDVSSQTQMLESAGVEIPTDEIDF